MKISILLSVFLVFASTIVMSQTNYPPTPEYEYAMLQVRDENDSYVVQYSNTGKVVRLKDILKINTKTESFTEIIYKCFSYLNSQGYELVSSTYYPNIEDKSAVGVPIEKGGYIFKRIKLPGINK